MKRGTHSRPPTVSSKWQGGSGEPQEPSVCPYEARHSAGVLQNRPLPTWPPDAPTHERVGDRSLATEKAAAGALSFTTARFFYEEDELIRSNGQTYAFSNQWGGPGWHNALTALKAKYPQFNIEFAPTS